MSVLKYLNIKWYSVQEYKKSVGKKDPHGFRESIKLYLRQRHCLYLYKAAYQQTVNPYRNILVPDTIPLANEYNRIFRDLIVDLAHRECIESIPRNGGIITWLQTRLLKFGEE